MAKTAICQEATVFYQFNQLIVFRKKKRKAEFLGVKGKREVSSEAYNYTKGGSYFKIFT